LSKFQFKDLLKNKIMTFKEQILQGIPSELPAKKQYPEGINRAPKRKDILTKAEKQLAIRNALRYFPKKWHRQLAVEFAEELQEYGRIYMYRFKPDYEMYARPIDEYPARSKQAAGIMMMMQISIIMLFLLLIRLEQILSMQ